MITSLCRKALPCISHVFGNHPEVLKFTKEQKKTIEEIANSAEHMVLKTKAKEIRAIEYQIKKKVFSGKASKKDLRPLLDKVAELRIEQTLRFFAVQNRVINMLNKEQYRKVIRIITK